MLCDHIQEYRCCHILRHALEITVSHFTQYTGHHDCAFPFYYPAAHETILDYIFKSGSQPVPLISTQIHR
jgi:hypothetical protein